MSFRMLLIHSLVLHSFLCFTDSAFLHSQAPAKLVKTYPFDSLNALILQNLSIKKVVMLPDIYHGHIYFMNIVTDYLRYWIKEVVKHPNDLRIPHKLALFLEMTEEERNHVTDFIQSGDLSELFSFENDRDIKYGSDFFTVDHFKFVKALRDIKDNIRAIGETNPKIKLDLEILGAEASPPLTFETGHGMKSEEYQRINESWFVWERDRQSSAIITNYFKAHTDYRILVFIGNAHLIRRRSNKMINTKKEPIFNYWLAHYLDSLFTRDQVGIFQGMEQSDNSNSRIEEYDRVNEVEDYGLYYRMYPRYPISLYDIDSKATLQALFDDIESHVSSQKGIDKYLVGVHIDQLLRRLKRSYLYHKDLMKIKIDSIALIKDRFTQDAVANVQIMRLFRIVINNFDAIDNIKALNEWLFASNDPDSTTNFSRLRMMLADLPTDTTLKRVKAENRYGVEPGGNSLTDSEKLYISDHIDQLITCYLVNLLWISNPDEENKAVRALQEINGLALQSRLEWERWWRENHKFN
jgi:hypothetical protein